MRRRLIAIASVILSAAASPAFADPVEDFYKGRSITQC